MLVFSELNEISGLVRPPKSVVDIVMMIDTVKRVFVRHIQGRTFFESFRKIGTGEKKASQKSDMSIAAFRIKSPLTG